jgi:hypothetical protein
MPPRLRDSPGNAEHSELIPRTLPDLQPVNADQLRFDFLALVLGVVLA